MAMWTGLGDNTELFWAVLSQLVDIVPVSSEQPVGADQEQVSEEEP
jgi:hypothetical protein